MINWPICCFLWLTLLSSGCSTNTNYKTIGETPQNFIEIISPSDFDLNHIESIILFMGGEIIATLQPRHIQQGIKHPDRQYAAWQLTFLNEHHIYESLSEDNAILVIDRITPQSPTDRRIMLNPGPQVINIGGFDHTLIIYQSKEQPNQHRWIYYSGAGEVCSGIVAFVIHDSP